VIARLPYAILDRLAAVLGRRPRLAARALRVPRVVPWRSLRSRLYQGFSWRLSDGLSGPLAVTSVGGRMVVDPEDPIGKVLAVSGEWEPHVTAAFRAQLRPGDVCVDVGAHVGYYTLLASRLVGPSGHVYALEPSPGVYRRLSSNLALNGVANVTALNVAAGAVEGSAVLHQAPGPSPGTSSLSSRVLESPHGGRPDEYVPVEVSVAPVDSVVPDEAYSRVRMVKVDVEGYEIEALRGLEGILAAAAPLSLLVEVSPDWSVVDPAEYLERLCSAHGLIPYRLLNEYSLEGYFPRRLQPAAGLERIPSERCDLLLVRE
jgi:FkbM family methyltransferase